MKRALPTVGIAVFVAALFLTGCSLLQTAPMIDFTASSTEGRAPFTVRFTPETDGTPISYAWSFGDGHTSEELSPVHVYARHGTYSVTLSVEYADQPGATLIKKRLITVNLPLARDALDYLYWLSGYAVRRGFFHGGGEEVVANDSQPPSGLDVAGDRVYWVTTRQTGGVLESANADGTDRQTLVEEENRLGAVAVDVKRGKIYWTALPESPLAASMVDPGSGERKTTWDGGIRCANLDGSDVETLLVYPSGSGTYADRIAVEPDAGMLVWTVVGDDYEGAICQAGVSPFKPFAGTLVTGVGHPVEIALDTVPGFGADHVYYTTEDGELRREGLYWFGSSATILTGLDEPGGIAIDPIRYYLYVGTADGILRAVTDGTDAMLLFEVEQKVGSVILPR